MLWKSSSVRQRFIKSKGITLLVKSIIITHLMLVYSIEGDISRLDNRTPHPHLRKGLEKQHTNTTSTDWPTPNPYTTDFGRKSELHRIPPSLIASCSTPTQSHLKYKQYTQAKNMHHPQQKRAKRYGHTSSFTCPICHLADSFMHSHDVSHIAGECAHPAMTKLTLLH